MFILEILYCLLVVILTAKLDKNLNKDSLEKSSNYDDWYEYYNGRITLYKVSFVLSFIPFVNFMVAFIFTAIMVFLLGLRVATSKFWNKGFWNKLF